LTVAKLREHLKDIDVDNNHRVAFLEYALYKYNKSPQTFFDELKKPHGGGAALQKAIEEYRKILAVRELKEATMAELEKTAALGGVKGMTAKNTLAQMKSEDELAQRKAEITSEANKRKAAKNATDPFEEEQKRLAEEKKKSDEEEKRKREESRAKLAAKTAAFGGQK